MVSQSSACVLRLISYDGGGETQKQSMSGRLDKITGRQPGSKKYKAEFTSYIMIPPLETL